MDVRAKLQYLRMSPRKVRLVADMVRGMDAIPAQMQLKHSVKNAARPILKLLESAMANAEHNDKLVRSNLYIKSIMVNDGPTLKRWKPRAFGRASGIQKRTSHVSIVLGEKVVSTSKKEIATKPATDKKDAKKKLAKKTGAAAGKAVKKTPKKDSK